MQWCKSDTAEEAETALLREGGQGSGHQDRVLRDN